MVFNKIVISVATGLVVLMAYVPLRAQNFRQVIVAMQKEYAQMDKLHILMHIEVFENENANQPYYDEKADIKKSGVNYRYCFGSNEMLMNKKCMVIVDKEAHEIMYSPRNLKVEKQSKDIFQVSIDSLLHFYEPPKYVGTENGIEQYTLLQKDGVIQEVKLFINTATAMLQKIKYQYHDSQHAVISFEIFDKQPTFNDDIFNENEYVVSEKGKLRAANAFAHYSIVEAEK